MPHRDTRCPFCRLDAHRLHQNSEGSFHVLCEACGARGPISQDESTALERWMAANANTVLLRTVIDESPDVILLKDWDGHILLGNATLARLYGTSTDELVGMTTGHFNPNAEQVASYQENIRAVMLSGQPQVVEESSTDAESGEVRHFHSIKKPIKGPNGEPRVLIIAHDVTELQRAHQKIAEREKSHAHAMSAAREALERSNQELELRVADRTRELEFAIQELHALARRDSLTGLPNRLAITERLQEEFSRYKRTQLPYSVLLFDVDHFKRINDTHGHDVGDLALQHVAGHLRSQVRECDFVARHGGEEFLVLLPETQLPGAIQLADKIRQTIEDSAIPVVGHVTISAGAAMVIPNDVSSDRAIKQADFELYEAKRWGRNRISPASA